MAERLVVDASVAFKWLHPEDDSEAAETLRRRFELHAPELIRIECTNALWSAARRDGARSDKVVTALAVLEAGFHSFHPDAPCLAPALRLALEISHPIYDCCYLALAIDLDCLLVTADLRFVRALAATPYAAHARALADLVP